MTNAETIKQFVCGKTYGSGLATSDNVAEARAKAVKASRVD
jgi:hypothetical protein